MTYDVLVIGGSGVDTIVRVADLEIPPSDSLGVPPIRDYVAHTGNGAALGFHALGLATKFIDFIGDDPQGDLIRARYQEVGLDFSSLPAPAGTPRSVNLVDRGGRRFSFYDGRHPADLRFPADFYRPFLARTRHVHLSGGGLCRDLLPDLYGAGVTVSTDLHAWDGSAPYAVPFAYGCDIVFMSAATVGDRAPKVLRDILDRGRAQVAVATDGADGCHVATRTSPDARHFPALAPEQPVVDSNGAGDAFMTAFTDSWLKGLPLDHCVRAGSLSGAFACTTPGTHERLITRPELDALMFPGKR
ncbi:carbohydrate kinase family protein [Peterkaempfera griseoplana]|uniref:carbohydrate kinase family protein n=1 Tax=Peterkaempfera griseoplana TaxID=66896 RepID=UPI0006E24046|nr:carbohydrate kinase family protein [Peterkaempfera griseoplana]